MINDDAQKGHKSSPLHQLEETDVPHDIFLSHSGTQKDFVKDLYKELKRNNFSTFLDIEHHSLLPGDHFPSRIILKAKSCRVALVVLSEEFLCSRWPMIELHTFVDAMDSSSGGLRLVPLFFKLSPADLKSEENLKRWRKSWTAHAEKDDKNRIDVSKWEDAVRKLLSHNGIQLFEQGSEGAELAYIDKIVKAVSVIVRPAFIFDTTFIAGKDRLCQVILDKLESMDHHQSSRVTISSLESASASTSTSHSIATCVLGLYGLPGSGKSTLCKCLVDYYRGSFGSTNTLYLKFSSTPSNAEVVSKLTELRHLTSFRERVGLDTASELENVESLLKSCGLSRCKVFLVLDNISDNNLEAVLRILHLGFGHGSKIILVAHTLEVLRKPLDSLKKCWQHWACDSMVIPRINEMEASEILLRTATGSYAAPSDKHTVLESLTPRQRGTVRRIVHMCSFDDSKHTYGQYLWLPLVMKAVGTRLFRYEKDDLERWESDVESFRVRVRTYEQSAVIEELLGDNFKALPEERHQLLFMDVALFILHLENEIDGVIDALSMMHDGFDTSIIRMMIQDLERRGFLIVSEGIVGVHDLYLKFARSIQDCGQSKYMVSCCRWEAGCHYPDAELEGNSLFLKEDQSLEDKGKLRALVLEVAGESCERVDLQGFSGLKAVLLRNCKSVAVLGLAGLGSLRILEVRNCGSLGGLECSDRDYSSLLNINSFSVCGIRFGGFDSDYSSLLTINRFSNKALAEVDQGRGRQLALSFVNAVKRVMMAPFRQPHSLGVGFDIISKMRSLQVVRLEDTGIGRLECVGGMWPQLRDLTVIEQHLQRFELGCLPKLEQIFFIDVGPWKYSWIGRRWKRDAHGIEGVPRISDSRTWECWSAKKGDVRYSGIERRWSTEHGRKAFRGSFSPSIPDRTSEIWRRKEGDVRYLLAGQDFLLRCPQMKQVTMISSFFKQGQLGSLPAGVERLTLQFLFTATELPDLSLSAHTLADLMVLGCEKLERVNLDKTGFKSLTTLELSMCHNIVEVNVLGSLPNLSVLRVSECRKLQILKGFENSEMLEELHLVGLSELREFSYFSSLRESLQKLTLLGCPKLTIASVARADHLCDVGKQKAHLCDMDNLRVCLVSIIADAGECCFNLSNCRRLHYFKVFCDYVNEGSRVGALLKLEGLEEWGGSCLYLTVTWQEADHCKMRSGEYFDERDDAALKCGLASMVRLDKGSLSVDLSLLHPRDTVSMGIRPGGCLFSMGLRFCHVLDSIEGVGQNRTLEWLDIWKLCNLRSLRGVESHTQLRTLQVIGCPALEEVPSLHALVHLQNLGIQDCPKVKAVEGCEFMTRLSRADFTGCKSMERLPTFSSLDKFCGLRFVGCKFANEVKTMATWVMDESAPIFLRWAALEAVLDHYTTLHPTEMEKKELVAELCWWCLLKWMPLDNNSWLDFSWLEHAWVACINKFQDEPLRAAAVRAAVRKLGHQLKLLQYSPQSHLRTSSIIDFLDDPHIAKTWFHMLKHALDTLS